MRLHLGHKSAELKVWAPILLPITLEYKYLNIILSWKPLQASTHQALSVSLSAQDQATLFLSLTQGQATTCWVTTTSTDQLVLHPSHFPTFLQETAISQPLGDALVPQAWAGTHTHRLWA
jgi:hypothetical protein